MGVIALVIGGLALGATAAEAESVCPPSGSTSYPAGSCTLVLSSQNVAPGGDITVSGSGFKPGSTVEVTLSDGTVLGTALVGADGSFSGVFKIPANKSGQFRVLASGVDPNNDPFVLSSALTAAPGGTPAPGGRANPPGGRLARTGINPLATTGAGLALAAAGLGLTLAARRRKLILA